MKISPKYRGIFFIVFSAFNFACMGACVRLAGDIPVIQKSFFRNAVSFLIAFVLIIREGKGFKPSSPKNWPLLIGRSTLGTVGILANFYALDHLLLPDASMLNKMAPFFAVIASYFILKESLSAVQLISLGGALCGALCIIKPSFANMSLFPSIIGLIGGLSAGFAYTLVRKLGKNGERPNLIVLIFSGFSCLVALPFILFDYTPMAFSQFMALIGAGVFAAGGQYGVTAAYCYAPARELSVYDYSQVIFSAIIGYFLFNDIPDILSFIGYALIIGMAILSFWYNNHHVRKLPKA